MPDLKAIFAQIDAMEDEIVAVEQDLVRIPSVNTGTMPTGGETPGRRARQTLSVQQ